MTLLLLIVGALLMFAGVGWFSRQTAFSRSGWRLPAGIVATALLFAGLMMSFRGNTLAGGLIVLAAVVLGVLARVRVTRKTAPAAHEQMSAQEARAVLGVPVGAAPQEIRAAYTRLMRMNHPDAGGTAGLAARLNAARDRLL